MSKPRPLPIRLDFQTRVPAYLQIYRQVQRLAAAGRLVPGDQLPTVRQLARQLGVNFNTTARAYRALHTAGIVTTQRGRGTFVRADWSARGSSAARPRLLAGLAAEYVSEARRHGFTDGEILRGLRRRLASSSGPR